MNQPHRHHPHTLTWVLATILAIVTSIAVTTIIHVSGSGDTAAADRRGALPEARYDAVIPGLIPFTRTLPAGAPVDTHHLRRDTVLYGADRKTPVAVLRKRNFIDRPTTTIAVRGNQTWTLILTPARQQLPSSRTPRHPSAPAQTAAWAHTADLAPSISVRSRATVHVNTGTLTITDPHGATHEWPAGIGAPNTPTPVGVTGYLQERYRDPAQGQRIYPIQLTSLHATAADEPYRGHDGGLIGIHYATGPLAVATHGCVRVHTDTITALTALPVGTPITLEP
ncbi:L,D-transpeptidase [Curtobacterium sp. MCLR17_054]|uniref:L,D-transpeptidase n=1 Tax=Curtobacterium sp. MCLR17_054 TaxID=2175632 RepID=UPI000DA8C373|nr:L,D-transpeptidase [Curtobacterium sp. MCLR17_054]WIE70325.1 L,D-transpeptidase [Curtobacterium sp. MCLR17_054]